MWTTTLRLYIVVLLTTLVSYGQGPPASVPTLTLQDALERAKVNSVQFLSAITDAKIAHEDAVQARAAVLPSVTYNNAYLFTEGTGTGLPRFIANNAVHEYVSQGNAHQTINLGAGALAELRRARAAEALAHAKADVATRGLVVTVVQNYYGLIAAQQKLVNSQAAAKEAQNFLDLSKKLEGAGEVAHSDTIKAQLQSNDRARDALEAELAAQKAKLALAVLLFPNFNQDFSIVDDLNLVPPLPTMGETEELSRKNNPDLRAALATVQAASAEINVARGGHFPTLSLDYFYGIDAAQFAVRSPEGVRNLGYAAEATLNIPIWNWGATQSKVKQAEYRQQLAKAELSATQRQLVANLRSFYAEAQIAEKELDTLRASADLAAESLRLTTLRYQAGEATALEVVDAQNTLVNSRSLMADGAVRYRTALANLQTLTGTF
jgi:outer membrane protein TolC